MNFSIRDMMIALPAIMIAITFHEYAHGRVADYLGDDTPYLQGRLTLNPIPHIDIIGFVMLLIAGFGWAKPVQVNPYRFKRVQVKEGMMLVSLAGPAMNMLLAIAGAAMMKLTYIFLSGNEAGNYAALLIDPLVTINIALMLFNLIPVPPLDGSKILAGLLPDSASKYIFFLEQYGTLILLLLFLTGIFSRILGPLIIIIRAFLYGLFF